MRLLDINPANSSTLILSGASIDLIRNQVGSQAACVGAGYPPSYDPNGWLPGVPSMNFTGSATYTDLAKQYLFDDAQGLYDQIFSCVSGSLKAWTVFVVAQLNQKPAVECSIFEVSQQLGGSPPVRQAEVFLYSSTSNFNMAVYSDNNGPSTGLTLGTNDTSPHVFEMTADGMGNIDGAVDGLITSGSDVFPKTCGAMLLGSVFAIPTEQMNGKIARVIIYNEKLSSIERTKVRNQLGALYGIDL